MAAPSHSVQLDGDDVLLQVHELPVAEFVQLAQRVTNQVYTYDRRDLEAKAPISLIGEVRCPRTDFDDFVATMLHTRGLATVAREAEGGVSVIEIRAL